MTLTMPKRTSEEDGKFELIRMLRNDPDVISAFKDGLEARKNGDRIHWNEAKVSLGIE